MKRKKADTPDDIAVALQIQTAALMVAFITAGAFIAIPLPGTPVPIVLQNMFVVLAGILLAPKWAAAAVGVYLLLGAIGLPIFAGATGGLSHFAGPTGGFLVGFLVSAPSTSFVIRRKEWVQSRPSAKTIVAASVIGLLVPYIPGVLWLQRVAELQFSTALGVGALPFLPGDILKLVLLVMLLRVLPLSVWRRSQ